MEFDFKIVILAGLAWSFASIAAYTALVTFLPDCRLQRETRRRLPGLWLVWCVAFWAMPFDIRTEWNDTSRLFFDDAIFLILAVQTSVVIWKEHMFSRCIAAEKEETQSGPSTE